MKIGIKISTYRTYNSTTRFIKYEFNNKLLNGVTLFRVTQSQVTLGVTLSNVTLFNIF